MANKMKIKMNYNMLFVVFLSTSACAVAPYSIEEMRDASSDSGINMERIKEQAVYEKAHHINGIGTVVSNYRYGRAMIYLRDVTVVRFMAEIRQISLTTIEVQKQIYHLKYRVELPTHAEEMQIAHLTEESKSLARRKDVLISDSAWALEKEFQWHKANGDEIQQRYYSDIMTQFKLTGHQMSFIHPIPITLPSGYVAG
ncbi:MAG: hypothetical protein C0514_08705 [Candidatus Puniceispirillum sp.]|nr:hypothetical protein [Candidatus Puniceispirillum sp.]